MGVFWKLKIHTESLRTHFAGEGVRDILSIFLQYLQYFFYIAAINFI